MSVAVAEGLASDNLDAVAEGFLRWHRSNPPDIGIQTSAVLSATSRRLAAGEGGVAKAMVAEAAAYAAAHAHAAGNGALMRTSPVALYYLASRGECAKVARAVASLTHADPLAGDSCVLWSEAIRVAVLEGRIDFFAGLDLLPSSRRSQWAGWLRESVEGPASRFTPNGFTVTALQAAVAAIALTPVPSQDPGAGSFPCLHLQSSLHAAVRIGHDTDTVAAIAGGLLGARWGASAIPWRWRRAVHGWPGRDGRDLVSIATLAVRGGRDDGKGWPSVDDVRYREHAAGGVVPHPHDDGVLLGTHRSRGHGATAVVAMCRVGPAQRCFGDASVVVESRLMDEEDPARNPNLHFALYDAADAVRGLRAEGHKVLLHCVAAHQRTPSVAVAYSLLLGTSLVQARRDVLGALADARGRGTVWDAVADLEGVE